MPMDDLIRQFAEMVGRPLARRWLSQRGVDDRSEGETGKRQSGMSEADRKAASQRSMKDVDPPRLFALALIQGDSSTSAPTSRHFSGVTAVRPWKWPFESRAGSRRTSFNGATAVRLWKCCAIRERTDDFIVSMRPPR